MPTRFSELPASLAQRTIFDTLGGAVPALIAQPDGDAPSPFVLWMHGRTVRKELDPGRYLRWVRAGIAAVALDLPGHGARFIPGVQDSEHAPAVIAQMVNEIDPVLASLRDRYPRLDFSRAAIGGMSAGGMATLRRLCDPHPFVAAAVEGTTGDLTGLYLGIDRDEAGSDPTARDRATIESIDAGRRLDSFKPIPLLALHTEGDEMVPIEMQRAFLKSLGGHYRDKGASPDLISLHTFRDTGAPHEHAGFGRSGSEAKDLQVEFFKRVLRPAHR